MLSAAISRWNCALVNSWSSHSATAMTVADAGRSVIRLISPRSVGASIFASDWRCPSGPCLRTSTLPCRRSMSPLGRSPSLTSAWPAATLCPTEAWASWSTCCAVSPRSAECMIFRISDGFTAVRPRLYDGRLGRRRFFRGVDPEVSRPALRRDECQPRDTLARLETAGHRRGGYPGTAAVSPHASDELCILGTEQTFQPPSDLARQRRTPAAGRDRDLKLSPAKHRGQDEVTMVGPIDDVHEHT